MYMPKEAIPVKKRLSAQSRSKRTRIGVLLALLVLIFGGVWALWVEKNEIRAETSAEEMLQHDLEILWRWSDDQLTSGSSNGRWTIRWDVTGKQGMKDALVSKLFKDEEGRAIEKLIHNDGNSVTGDVPSYGGRISVNLVEKNDSQEQLMLLLETDKIRDKGSLLKAAAAVSEKLVDSEAVFTSSMKVQGFAANANPANDFLVLSNAKAIDRYEDEGTISETFYTGKLRSAIDFEGKTANIQIAVHEEAETNKSLLTIGIPLITGDYSFVQFDER
ncbi:YwmB family TATA-box binding protein [Paenibacillus sp. sgz302251]|uniref:YwmB family TATA-box binding protein n=1 Tax=Paenibacillus sp. sgz302251 TaxID=3414493 RepID=UPI003C7BE2CF